MVKWDEVVDLARTNCVQLPFSLELRFFFSPLMEVIANDLIGGKIKGYSANGEEPPAFSDSIYRAFIGKTGPAGVIFSAQELESYIGRFDLSGTSYHEGVFCSAKKAFLGAIQDVQDQSWNMSLSPVIFSCNKEDFEREVGGAFTPAQQMH